MKVVLANLSTMDLLLARDEVLDSRNDLAFFFDARFMKAGSKNDSNPHGLPSNVRQYRTELAAQQARVMGLEVQHAIEQYDRMILDITSEILTRCQAG